MFLHSAEEIQNNICKSAFSAELLLNNLIRTDVLFTWKSVTHDEIYHVIMKLSNCKSQDYHGFSNFLLKL